MPTATIHYPVVFPDEVHTDFYVWLRNVRNELYIALAYRKLQGHTTRVTHHRSAYALTGEGFAKAVAEIDKLLPPPKYAGHEGLRLSLAVTLRPQLTECQLSFKRVMWEVDRYQQRLARGAILTRGFGHAEPKPMAQCWRLLYIIEPAKQGGLIAPPPEPMRPPGVLT